MNGSSELISTTMYINFKTPENKYIFIQLHLKKSNIPNAGLGVFAVKDISRDILKDEYLGYLLNYQTDDSTYTWRIFPYNSITGEPIESDDELKPIGYIDAKRTDHWTRYVNCSVSPTSSNIEAYQSFDKIYYKASRDIKKGEELLVWYGQEYYDHYITK